MDQIFGLPFLGAISAFGWAAARVLIDGFTGAAGGWLFPTIACAAGFWAFIGQLAEGDAYSLFKHVGAIALAAILLYAPVRVNLTGIVNGQVGAVGAIDINQGAAPMPTQLIDWIGMAAAAAVKAQLVGADQRILPMLDQALRDAAADRASFQDGQIAMNVAVWRTLVASAILANSSAASAIDGQGLRERLLSPAPADPSYAGTQTSGEVQQVLDILQTLSPSPGDMLCRNTAIVADLAGRFGALPWTAIGDCAAANPGPVSVLVISQVTRSAMAAARQPTPGTGPSGPKGTATQDAGGRATAVLDALFSAQAAALDTGSFADWPSLYRSLGAATLAGAAAQLGRDPQFKVLLGSDCAARGDSDCAGVFGVSAHAMESYITNRDPAAPWYERVLAWVGSSEPGSGPVALVAAAVGSIVSVLMKLLAHMVASLTPYALAAARAIAVLLGVLGIYLLLVPGRIRDGLALMVGPMAWVHIWTILFVIWYSLETIGDEAASRLPIQDSPGADVAARAVVRFVLAVGYASLPYIAWKIVFGGLSRTVPRLPLDRLVVPARNYMVRQAKSLLPRDTAGRRVAGVRGANSPRSGTGPATPAGSRRSIPSNTHSLRAPPRAQRKRS
jgi:hypothetical protein